VECFCCTLKAIKPFHLSIRLRDDTAQYSSIFDSSLRESNIITESSTDEILFESHPVAFMEVGQLWRTIYGVFKVICLNCHRRHREIILKT
jgi:hypothetical protein